MHLVITSGTRIGPYEVLGSLGAGGMGEVYRARDTRLKREVAVKVLPASVAADRDRVARFEREAEILAALNQPNIANIYGVEESDGMLALIIELIDGDDLAARIARGPIPLDEALTVAGQIADALEAAHERGIIHRDLKPSNVKVRPDGVVKVLDFGLAKVIGSAGEAGGAGTAGAIDVTNSPTITSPALLTGMGIILGTAAYMAPEQARGKPVDRRADIWAFGCVLFEMLSGRRPFSGNEVTDVIVAVVSQEPDWERLPANVPDTIRRLIRRCLIKDLRGRLPHIGAARLEIDEALQGPRSPGVMEQSVPHSTARSARARWWSVAAVAAAFAAATASAMLAARFIVTSLDTTSALAEPTRLMLAPAPQHAISVSGFDRDLAISPDGRRVAYVGGNATAILVRGLDRVDPIRIDAGGMPHHPFFSPDGAWIGFVDGFSALRRVPAAGGRVETICRTWQPELTPTWGDDGTIVFRRSNALWRVAAAGGEPEPLLSPDPKSGEVALISPQFLPGAREILFGIIQSASAGSPLTADTTIRTLIAVLDLKTRRTKIVLRDANNARYVNSGHLIYQSGTSGEVSLNGRRAGDVLRAVRFDLARLEIVGEPITLDEPIFKTPLGGYGDFDVSATGTLAYVPESIQAAARRLVWMDREGREEPIDLPVRAYAYPSIDPSGKLVALDIRDQDNDIWIWDIARHTLRRLTFDRAVNQYPVWSPDGRRVASMLPTTLRWQSADGSGAPDVLATNLSPTAPYSFSADGGQLVFRQNHEETGHDLMRLVVKTGKVEPLLQTRFNELNARISPDGRWLAYQSDESGSPEIYVRPFPDVNAGRWQVSTGGGRVPTWSGDGRELFYLVGDGTFMSAAIEPGPSFVSRTPVKLFSGNFYLGGGNSIGRTYDVMPDGRRFLMIKADAGPPIAPVVVLHWTEELRRRLPTR